jgi:hypothetical protein
MIDVEEVGPALKPLIDGWQARGGCCPANIASMRDYSFAAPAALISTNP